MCFAALIQRKQVAGIHIPPGLQWEAVLRIIEQNAPANDEGYFIGWAWDAQAGPSKRELRTLDYKEFLGTVMENRESIDQARTIAIHLRKSTNKVSQENVHGWTMAGGRWCYHNGVVTPFLGIENDSLDFFTRVQRGMEDNGRQAEDSLWRTCGKTPGYGAFFMADPRTGTALVAAMDKECHAYELVPGLLVVTSAPQGWPRRKTLRFTTESDMVKLGMLELLRPREETMELGHPEINPAEASFDGKLITFQDAEATGIRNLPERKEGKDYSRYVDSRGQIWRYE